jgi:hypothetical protein
MHADGVDGVPGDSPVDGTPLPAAATGGGIGSRISGILLAVAVAGRLLAGPLGLVGCGAGLGGLLSRPRPLSAGRNWNFLRGDGGGGRGRSGGNRGRRSLHE